MEQRDDAKSLRADGVDLAALAATPAAIAQQSATGNDAAVLQTPPYYADPNERLNIIEGETREGARAWLAAIERIDRLEKTVAMLYSQQSIADRQLEIHARATALDLAIKAQGPGAEAATTTEVAAGFLAWLKAGLQ